MRVEVTKLVLADGHEIPLDPPMRLNQGEPIPLYLTLGDHIAVALSHVWWYEIVDDDEVVTKRRLPGLFIARWLGHCWR